MIVNLDFLLFMLKEMRTLDRNCVRANLFSQTGYSEASSSLCAKAIHENETLEDMLILL